MIRWPRLILLGTLAGLGYNLDLGVGPVLLGCVVALVAFRCRRFGPVLGVILAAMPWLAAHHGVNYAIGGVWRPMNAVPELMTWPGSPFNANNLTGIWRHDPAKLVVYALALLFGKHGFIGHNLPLFLSLAALPLLLRRRTLERPEVVFSVVWCAGTWLTYAALSNNYGGACCSVRWFVPFLASGYYVLAVCLLDYPEYRGDFAVLSVWGAVLGAVMWWNGPWIIRMVPWFWQIQAAALLSWGGWCFLRNRLKRSVRKLPQEQLSPRAAAA
jgi:hypothetical protein